MAKKKDPIKGTGKKPKGSGRRLYTDENPKDTVPIRFATVADALGELDWAKRSLLQRKGEKSKEKNYEKSKKCKIQKNATRRATKRAGRERLTEFR